MNQKNYSSRNFVSYLTLCTTPKGYYEMSMDLASKLDISEIIAKNLILHYSKIAPKNWEIINNTPEIINLLEKLMDFANSFQTRELQNELADWSNSNDDFKHIAFIIVAYKALDSFARIHKLELSIFWIGNHFIEPNLSDYDESFVGWEKPSNNLHSPLDFLSSGENYFVWRLYSAYNPTSTLFDFVRETKLSSGVRTWVYSETSNPLAIILKEVLWLEEANAIMNSVFI